MFKTYYDILNIPKDQSDVSINSATLKRAYKKALLLYHPDKVVKGKESGNTANLNSGNDIPTIDEITTAYQTLLDAKARSEYDRELRLIQENEVVHSKVSNRSVGLEVIDLDDMSYDDTRALWTRDCRCGTSGGFVLSEEDLEKAVEGFGGENSLEILVGCSGCSLCLKVSFAIAKEA